MIQLGLVPRGSQAIQVFRQHSRSKSLYCLQTVSQLTVFCIGLQCFVFSKYSVYIYLKCFVICPYFTAYFLLTYYKHHFCSMFHKHRHYWMLERFFLDTYQLFFNVIKICCVLIEVISRITLEVIRAQFQVFKLLCCTFTHIQYMHIGFFMFKVFLKASLSEV